MKQLQNLDEATSAFLTYSPRNMTGKYNLSRITQLMTALNHPEQNLRVIHIAGTSGKTSTAYFIRGLLEAAGCKTGLTVSPHIVAINERVQISGVPLEETQFLIYVNQFFERIETSDIQPTYFELLVALAYWIFAQEKVEYAVVETGLGGLLDGTNIITRADKVCVITDIGLDHTEVLGGTLQEIAAQKAGIIQPHNHTIVRGQTSTALNVITAYAKEQQAEVDIITDEEAPSELPKFQHRNWAMAMAAFHYVQTRDNLPALTNEQERSVTLQTPPGRWERYRIGNKTVILDGAHNPQKLQALIDSLHNAHIDSAAVCANFIAAPDHKVNAALKLLQPITSHLIIPEFSVGQDSKSRRSIPAHELATIASQLGISSTAVIPIASNALTALLARPEKTLLITGSLYLVSILRPHVIAAAKQ